MTIKFTANGFSVTPELEKYARSKVAQLTRKVPRQLRAEAVCIVAFSQVRKKDNEFNTCSIGLTVGDTQLKSEETTLHMYSSLDIAAVHIGNQLKDYAAQNGRRHIRAVLRAHTRRHAS